MKKNVIRFLNHLDYNHFFLPLNYQLQQTPTKPCSKNAPKPAKFL